MAGPYYIYNYFSKALPIFYTINYLNIDKTGIAVKQSKIIIKIMTSFAGFHTEATSSGHSGNVRLTKYYIGTYQDGAAVDLDIDKEGGVRSGCMYLPINMYTDKDSNLLINYLSFYKVTFSMILIKYQLDLK